jgi:hypothetical protein
MYEGFAADGTQAMHCPKEEFQCFVDRPEE